MITAPFNFVPLNKKVFFPYWAESVSLDIPFEDEVSGEIDITITAHSPIFIKNHEDERFCNYKGEFFIPATSFKGMIRNVLEILSFAKLNFFDDRTYAVRDLNNKKLYRDNMQNVRCGWLRKDGDKLIIEDCGEPYRIRYDEIDREFNINFKENFLKGTFNNSNSPYKKAQEKYELLKKMTNIDFLNETFKFKYIRNDANRKVVEFDKQGDIEGKIVLTGHPSARDESKSKPVGKIYDFVFPIKSIKEYQLDEKVFEDFKFAYFDGRETQPKESPDWKFWKNKLYKGEKIPVFFQVENEKVINFGLSYLYKLPYKYSISKGIPDEHKKDKLDLVETIFGYTNKDKALKGRVYFSHFKAVKGVIELDRRCEILGTPRASYYPIYIKQNGQIYKTYMDADFSIAGRKRYPIHKGSDVVITQDTGNENVRTCFIPLDKGVVFKGKMRFHNLKPAELGAVLSALTFHNCKECFHNIGLAKALGYGKIKVEVNGVDVIKYLKEFEKLMRANIDNWIESDELIELFTMAVEQNNKGNSRLEYMQLKEFAKNKNENEYLKPYSKLDGIIPKKPKSVLSEDEIKEIEKIKEEMKQNELRQKELKKQKQLQEEFNRDYENIKKCDDLSKLDGFIRKYQEKFDVSDIKDKLEKLKQLKQEDKFKEVNQKAKKMFDEVMKKRGSKGFEKAKEKFIKKYSKEKEHKNSPFVLELVEKLKNIK